MDNKIINKSMDKSNSSSFFYTSSPRDIVSGSFNGILNITKGVFTGLVGLIGTPIYYSNQGPKGIAKGIGIGLVLSIALPLGGVIMGTKQILHGLVNTPIAMYSKYNGKIWDKFQNKWIYYSLEEEINKYKDIKQTKKAPVYYYDDPVKDVYYYDILGVEFNASKSIIKKKYYELAKTTHPDKFPEKESEFKLINEAYQILNDDELRQKYNKVGKDGIKETNFIDSETFYKILFGSEQLKFYIGEIMIYTISSTEFKTENLEIKQIKRELEIANNVLILLKKYLEIGEQSTEYYIVTKKNLDTTPFSNMLLKLVGRVYVEIGFGYLNQMENFKNYFKTRSRDISYKYNLAKSCLEARTDKSKASDVIINMVSIDIEQTIKRALVRLFWDHNVEKDIKKRYAEGLIMIGTIFKQDSKDIIETKKYLELVF